MAKIQRTNYINAHLGELVSFLSAVFSNLGKRLNTKTEINKRQLHQQKFSPARMTVHQKWNPRALEHTKKLKAAL